MDPRTTGFLKHLHLPIPENLASLKGLFKWGGAMVDTSIVSQEMKDTWVDAVQELTAQNIEVVFVLTPINPWVKEYCKRFDNKSNICRAMMVVPSAIDEIAQKSGALVIGDYDGEKIGLSWKDFVDCYHSLPSATLKIVSASRKNNYVIISFN